MKNKGIDPKALDAIMAKSDVKEQGVVKVGITLDAYLRKEVDNISLELGKTRSRIIADALEYYLDFLDLTIAERRLNDESDNVISSEEMEKFIDEMEAEI